jgi:hypothetical protein
MMEKSTWLELVGSMSAEGWAGALAARKEIEEDGWTRAGAQAFLDAVGGSDGEFDAWVPGGVPVVHQRRVRPGCGMSAFMVEDETLVLLAVCSMRTHRRLVSWDPDTAKEGTRIAALLHEANVASLRARYPRGWETMIRDGVSPVVTAADITRAQKLLEEAPGFVARECACFTYQSCETPDYYQSEAFHIVHGVESFLLRRLPGYEDRAGGSW